MELSKLQKEMARILLGIVKSEKQFTNLSELGNQKFITYSELNTATGNQVEDRNVGNEIGPISILCDTFSLPLLSAIVINKNTFMPGDGLLKIFPHLKNNYKILALKGDEAKFAAIKSVHNCTDWSKLEQYLYGNNKKEEAIEEEIFDYKRALQSAGIWFFAFYVREINEKIEMLNNDKNYKKNYIHNIFENDNPDDNESGTNVRVNSVIRIINNKKIIEALRYVISSKLDTKYINLAEEYLKELTEKDIELTEMQFDTCYAVGKTYAKEMMSSQNGNGKKYAKEVSLNTGMNEDVAYSHIRKVKALFNQDSINKELSTKHMKFYLEKIRAEFGEISKEFIIALKTIEKHLSDCDDEHKELKNYVRQYDELLDSNLYNEIEKLNNESKDNSNEDESIIFNSSATEGRKVEYYTSKYERSKKNRDDCIKINKTICKACGFDFYTTYGELGKDFIEVHHKKPLYSIKEETQINPGLDLVPVCSNCHRMLHRKRDTMLTVDDLAILIKKI